MSNAISTIESRAIEMLGSGLAAEQVAGALGVTASAISQLLAKEEISSQVSQLRYESLSKHNARDNKADSIEDRLLDKIESLMPLMMRPMEVIKAYQIINGGKRRGSTAPQVLANQQTVVQIVMPTVLTNKFVADSRNQVVRAGDQDLLTIQSGTLLKEFKGDTDAKLEERAIANRASVTVVSSGAIPGGEQPSLAIAISSQQGQSGQDTFLSALTPRS